MVLEEFDYESEAVINPSDCVSTVEGMPKFVVTCYEYRTFGRMLEKPGGKAGKIIKQSSSGLRGELFVLKFIHNDKYINTIGVKT